MIEDPTPYEHAFPATPSARPVDVNTTVDERLSNDNEAVCEKCGESKTAACPVHTFWLRHPVKDSCCRLSHRFKPVSTPPRSQEVCATCDHSMGWHQGDLCQMCLQVNPSHKPIAKPVEGSQERSETGGEWTRGKVIRGHFGRNVDGVMWNGPRSYTIPVEIEREIARDAEERALSLSVDWVSRYAAAEERATQAAALLERARPLIPDSIAVNKASAWHNDVLVFLSPSTEATPSEEE